MLRLISFLLAALLLTATGETAAHSQDVTPGGIQPSPAGCQTQPRDLDFFKQFTGEVQPDLEAGDVPPPTPVSGDPVSVDDVKVIESVVLELYACYNAADAPRLFALCTNDFMLELFEELGPMSSEMADDFKNDPAPLPDELQAKILEFDSLVWLNDKQISAHIRVDDPLTARYIEQTIGDQLTKDEQGEELSIKEANGDWHEFDYQITFIQDEVGLWRINDMRMVDPDLSNADIEPSDQDSSGARLFISPKGGTKFEPGLKAKSKKSSKGPKYGPPGMAYVGGIQPPH